MFWKTVKSSNRATPVLIALAMQALPVSMILEKLVLPVSMTLAKLGAFLAY